MVEILSIQKKKVFTLEQARELLPLIYRITEDPAKEVKYLKACYEALPNKSSDSALELQNKINSIVDRWYNKAERLGLKPKGLWLADFDNGNGYFCWKFPETEILYYHGYQDGFTGRVLIEDIINHESSTSSN